MIVPKLAHENVINAFFEFFIHTRHKKYLSIYFQSLRNSLFQKPSKENSLKRKQCSQYVQKFSWWPTAHSHNRI